MSPLIFTQKWSLSPNQGLPPGYFAASAMAVGFAHDTGCILHNEAKNQSLSELHVSFLRYYM
jgi:hypothetical protein